MKELRYGEVLREKLVKNAEEQFMKAQLAEDVEKMIKDFNEKGLE